MLTAAIVGGLVALGGLLIWLAFRYAKKAGALGERTASQEKSLDHARRAHEIDEDVNELSDSQLDLELYGDSKRD